MVFPPTVVPRLSLLLPTLPSNGASYAAAAPTPPLPTCFQRTTARRSRVPEVSATSRRRRTGSIRGLGPLGATVASWPAVEGAEGEEGGGRERTAVGEVSGSAQRSLDGVVLMEQEGPAWTEIVWDEVSVFEWFPQGVVVCCQRVCS